MAEKKNYRDTLNLPRTDFPMAASLTALEPRIQKKWAEMDLYGRIRQARRGAPKWVLHDGPPYANGDVHVGTGQNKILKDIVVKYRTMRGLDSPYVPGWDCHGLPIERKVLVEMGPSQGGLDKNEIRRRCRAFAEKYLDIQRRQFKSLGCYGDWDRPYTTYSREYESGILEVFEALVKRGFVTRGLRAIHWCPVDRTALAEAEIEYKDQPSPAVYLRFPVDDATDFLVWTTTPWTLPGNVAVAVHPTLEYAEVEYDSPKGMRRAILVDSLVETLAPRLKLGRRVGKRKGRDLVGLKYKHPITGRECPVVLAEYVRVDQGTGCVHTAPGHGEEDFLTGAKNGLPIVCPVDAAGVFTAEGAPYTGFGVFDANPRIVEDLRKSGILLADEEIRHSYPCCWRCKGPVIFRATEQWFIQVDHENGRQRALEAISKTRWVPGWGETRIRSMVETRPDWCVSRQRSWGVPIPAFYCSNCDAVMLTAETVAAAKRLFAVKGADGWFTTPAKEVLPPGTKCSKCGGAEFRREDDIFDVWFESACSHHSVLRKHGDLQFPAELYLEGTDQHRGWFQVSLLASLFAWGGPPFKTVVTHGFLKEPETRQKLSKSGFLIPADEVVRKLGADLLRLWIASIDFTDDLLMSWEILQERAEPYRKIRNTFRYLLSNLYDFDPSKDRAASLKPVDRWALARLNAVVREATDAMENYQFHRAYHALREFCVVDLSAVYFDLIKDRLYTPAPGDPARRSAQTALYAILSGLARTFAPLLAHTCEEVWEHLPGAKEPSVHLAKWPEADPAGDVEAAAWKPVWDLREKVLKELEALRAEKKIGKSVDAEVEVPFAGLPDLTDADLEEILGVSRVTRGAAVRASASPKSKCARCWKRRDVDARELCGACAGRV